MTHKYYDFPADYLDLPTTGSLLDVELFQVSDEQTGRLLLLRDSNTDQNFIQLEKWDAQTETWSDAARFADGLTHSYAIKQVAGGNLQLSYFAGGDLHIQDLTTDFAPVGAETVVPIAAHDGPLEQVLMLDADLFAVLSGETTGNTYEVFLQFQDADGTIVSAAQTVISGTTNFSHENLDPISQMRLTDGGLIEVIARNNGDNLEWAEIFKGKMNWVDPQTFVASQQQDLVLSDALVFVKSVDVGNKTAFIYQSDDNLYVTTAAAETAPTDDGVRLIRGAQFFGRDLVELPDGGFVVGVGYHTGGNQRGQVRLFKFDANADLVGELQLSPITGNNAANLTISVDEDGALLVSWMELQPGSTSVNEFRQMAVTADFDIIVDGVADIDGNYYGTGNDDLIMMLEGNDWMVAYGGNDTVYGGSGDDTLNGSFGENRLSGDGGYDRITGGVETDFIDGGSGRDILFGGNGNDDIYGNSGKDSIEGGAGDDTLKGGTGNERIFGGSGEDFISGQDGDDTLNGDEGSDTISGGEGNDSIMGGDAADFLSGSLGDDVIVGGAFHDTIYGNHGFDNLIGGGGFDSIMGGDGNDTLDGGTGHDTLRGGSDQDFLSGWTGKDWLFGGDGQDTLAGGSDADHVEGGFGHDLVLGGHGNDHVEGGNHNDTVMGQAGNDTLGGGHGNDVLYGGSGDDWMDGSGNQDTLYGGAGNDTLTGGHHWDTFVFQDDAGDNVITDFSSSDHEDIDLSAVSAITDFTDLVTNHIQESNGSAMIVAGDQTILLQGVAVDDIGEGKIYSDWDFVFS